MKTNPLRQNSCRYAKEGTQLGSCEPCCTSNKGEPLVVQAGLIPSFRVTLARSAD